MARALTSQEMQNLSRIREQMADAAIELADAIRTRKQQEAQLREVQRQMASPDGIATSEQFVDEVSRLRREIQIAIEREQEAGVMRSRLSRDELRIFAAAAEKSNELAGLNRTQRAATIPPSAGVSAATLGRMKGGLNALRRAQAHYERNSAGRTALEKTLESTIRKSMLIVFIAALAVAGLADFLSLFQVELNILVSWIIPMISWFIVRRVTAINAGGEAIVGAHKAAKRQLTLLQQRLRPALRSTPDGIKLLASSGVNDLVFSGKSYVGTFARNTIITQLAELIPVINFLPLYIGQVVKVFVDQNIAYQKVRKLMPNLQHVHQQIDRLEQFEIQDMARKIATVVRAQQIIGRQQSRQATTTQPRPATTPSSLALGYAT